MTGGGQMDFSLTEEQKQIKVLVRQFCEREVDQKRLEEIATRTVEARTVAELRACYPYDLVEKLHEVGLRQLQIPGRYGGTAPEVGVNVTLTMAAEEVGYWGGRIVDPLMIPWLFLRALATNMYVTEEQRRWIFSQFIKNPRLVVATSVGEPAGGTDIHLPYDEGGSSILRVTAYKDGGEWVINGDKTFCSNGGVADFIMVAARTDREAPVSRAMTFFWVPTEAPGITLTPNRMLTSEFGGNCQTHYDNVRVPESNLIGQVNNGFSIIESFFLAHLPGISGSLGLMQRIYEHMREYAKQRIGGGKAITRHTSVASKLGELAVNLEALRSLIYRGAWEIDQVEEAGGRALGESNWFWFAAGYALFKRVSWRFCELATDIYGGMSASIDLPLGGFLKHIFYIRAAGLTVDAELIRAGWDYDTRYRAV
jgi:alkylation response protein AidB-like acyl-CoA dehydrogenase